MSGSTLRPWSSGNSSPQLLDCLPWNLLSFTSLVDQIPTPPLLNRRVPLLSQSLIISAEEMDEVFRTQKHGSFLLTLDRITMLLRRLEMLSYLLRSRSIYIEI